MPWNLPLNINMCWNFQHAFNIVFNMHYRFQHMLKFSTCFQHSFQHALQISTCTEIYNMLFQHTFNMHYRFQHVLKFTICFFNILSTCITDFNMCWNLQYAFSTCCQHSFQHALQISTHAEIFNMFFQHSKVFHSMYIIQELHTNRYNFLFNIVFNMHYRFQHGMKFSTLQISICAEIFNMPFQDVFNTFQTWNSPMVWTMLKTVLKPMSNISKCIENHVENFKAYQKSPWCDHYVTLSINFET